MTEAQHFRYEADPTEQLSTEVVQAIAKAHDEDILDQKWRIADDINTDALNGLFKDHHPDTTLRFEADSATVSIIANEEGNLIITVESHR